MNKDSLVSVVVATYKREDTLKKALDSIANQTYNDIEIIVVDDNGNEEWNAKVTSIIKNFCCKYPNIAIKTITNNPNQGSAKTRNIGIENSSGKFVTFLDDDDQYLPEKIEKQVAFMQEGNFDYTITDLELYNEKDKLVDSRVRSYIKETTSKALLTYHLKYHLTGTDTMMFKKDYIISIGMFAPIDVGDEYYLIQRAIDGGGKFGYLPTCDVKAYIHTGEGGVSSGQGKIDGENVLFEYKKQYFYKLSRKDKRYIKMRHYAVRAFAYKRMGKFFNFIIEGFKAVFTAPFQCVKLLRTGW